MEKILKFVRDFILILLAVGTLIFAFLSWQSSEDAVTLSNKSLNLSESSINEIKDLNNKIIETNEKLGGIEKVLNITNEGIQKLEPPKPNIYLVDDAYDTMNTSQINLFCGTILNCSFNSFIPLVDNQFYLFKIVQIKNDGVRANKIKLNIDYSNKEFVVFSKDFLADDLSISINPLNKVIKLEIPELSSTSNVRFWIFTKQGTGDTTWGVQYDSDEIISGFDEIKV